MLNPSSWHLSHVQALWRIYRDPDNPLANSTTWRSFWSAFCTFNLAIMGSSVLPMPYALSKTGVLVGMLTMVLVALCNDYTTCLTISAAYTTGLDSFEALAYWAGGKRWKVRSQQRTRAVLAQANAVPYRLGLPIASLQQRIKDFISLYAASSDAALSCRCASSLLLPTAFHPGHPHLVAVGTQLRGPLTDGRRGASYGGQRQAHNCSTCSIDSSASSSISPVWCPQ